MPMLEEISSGYFNDLGALKSEASIVFDELVLPTWGSKDRHGFPMTLYGYVMGTMALLERLSCYAHARGDRKQQMERLLVETGADPSAAAVAVKIWRNGLMYHGVPYRVVRARDGADVNYLLHWGWQLPREQHMTFTPDTRELQVLCMALFYLLEDVEGLARNFFSRCAQDQRMANAVIAAERNLARARQV